jgi:glycosyltransferase involved in cell wall biosynthesis
MKIAFYVPNQHLKKVDFSSPEEGNPGTGAAEYLHVALPYFISDDNYLASIIAHNTSNMPDSIESIKCGSIIEAAQIAKNNEVDIFVFRPRIHEESNILDLIESLKLPSIGRAALTPSAAHQRKMAKTSYFKALVAVGSQQFESLIDSPIAFKLTCINNGITLKACDKFTSIKKNKKLVTYMGAIVPQKGFHVLARVWPEVLKQHPDAELRVIGSSKIYNENLEVGSLGIADEAYENEYLIPYLCDTNGKLHKSVSFLGILGPDKYKHISESLIGIVNPTGQTETCCVSAVEMSACSTAVVTGSYYALLDTVQNNITGLHGRGDNKLLENICKLLSNPELAIKLGSNGKELAKSNYEFNIVSEKWKKLFSDLSLGIEIHKPQQNFKYFFYHRKWIRLLNYLPAKIMNKFIAWPSTQVLEDSIWKVYKFFFD